MTGLAACRCGCPDAAHGHYRTGAECALCGCARYRRARPPALARAAAAIGRALGRKPDPVEAEIDDAIDMVTGPSDAQINRAIDDYYKRNGGRP